MKRVVQVVGALLLISGATLCGLLAVAAFHWTETDRAPELASGRREVAMVRSERQMVVAAHPVATRIGLEVLRRGGSAVDAAVAVQAALGLVEPQSSGIGGGAFMLYFDRKAETLHAYDGRETAPAAVEQSLFLHGDGEPFDFLEAVAGGRAVGVPGVLRLLEDAHKAHGRLRWQELFAGVIEVAEQGFEITPRLNTLAQADTLLRAMPEARAYFYDAAGRAKAAGTRLQNPQYAEVLREIAGGGADAFYKGPLADQIVDAVRTAKRPSRLTEGLNLVMLFLGSTTTSGRTADVPNGGQLHGSDLAAYVAKERRPVCVPYRRYRVCGMPPPTSGGIAALQILGMLSHFDLEALDPKGVQSAHLLAEAERLAYADRAVFVADPDFVDVPVARLLDATYLQQRAALISPQRSLGRASAGTPGLSEQGQGFERFAPGAALELPSTSHFSIWDAEGNVVSMTSSIENRFGARIMVGGFLLNNQLTDFSFVPQKNGRPVANAVAPGKRPRSSMSPLMVFDQESGEPVLAIGSPGGSRIIAYVTRATVAILDWKMGAQQAVALPHLVNRNGATELERDGWSPGELVELQRGLEALGHEVQIRVENSGLHGIWRAAAGLESGVDPRREGLALGD